MERDQIVKKHDKVYFVFGRFQPPTKGHELVINKMKELAGADSDMYIFTSNPQKQPPKKNPIPIDDKIRFLKKNYPDIPVIHPNQTAKTYLVGDKVIPDPGSNDPYKAVARLGLEGYEKHNMYIIAGSDRKEAYAGLKINVIEAGEPRVTRNNIERNRRNGVEVERQEGISGSMMRALAVSGTEQDYENFKSGVKVGAMTDSDVSTLWTILREKLVPTGGGKIKRHSSYKRRHVSHSRRYGQRHRGQHTRVQVPARPLSTARRRRD
jgi:hypothetical protein